MLEESAELIKQGKIVVFPTETEYKIMEKFFPGPLTIILKKKYVVPDIVTSEKDTVGVRMPSGETARKLIEIAGDPIATPSANIFSHLL